MEQHELVDENGELTGKVLTHIQVRNPENIPEGYYIAIAGIVIVNSKNEVLLQKRSKRKRVNPSKWGICGGKVDFQENPIDASIRETFEEIGVVVSKEELKLLTTSRDDKAHFTVFYVRKDVNLEECKLQEEEVEEVRYFKLDELEEIDREPIEWVEKLKEILK